MATATLKKRPSKTMISPEPDVVERVTRKIVRPTAVELVTDEIRQMILSGRISPGSVLRQEVLAEELGVSRVPVREAISRLHSEGLLNVVPHKGAYVQELSVDEVRETFNIRVRLEPWVFSEAIPLITDAEISKAERIVKDMDKATGGEWGSLNWKLHETLYRPARCEITLQMLRVLHDRCDRYFRFQVVKVPIREQSHAEHMAIIDACRNRDVKLGTRLLETHVKVASQQIMSIVEAVMAKAERAR
jgi:DNA-binding GntR family transcriptional regulator